MNTPFVLSCCALVAWLSPLSAQTKTPTTEKSLKTFIDKEILAYSTADNTEFIDRIKLAQRVWISYYKAELQWATLAAGLPLTAGEPLKGKALEKNLTQLKRSLIQTRYHDFIFKPARETRLPNALGDYSNPLIWQMERLLQTQREAQKKLADNPDDTDAKEQAEAAAAAAPFSEAYLLAAQYQLLLTQMRFANQMIQDWLKLKYRQHADFAALTKAQQTADEKWLTYLEAMQHIYIQQDKLRGQEQAHRLAIVMLLRRLDTLRNQLPFDPEGKDK